MKIVIEGAGEVGSHLAKMLSNNDNDITIIDSDINRLQDLSKTADVVTILGKSSSISCLEEASVKNADLFIAVNPNTEQDINIVSSLISKKLGCKKVCARIDDEEYLSSDHKFMFIDMGIDLMFYPEKIAAQEIVHKLYSSGAYDSMDFSNGKMQLSVFKLDEDSPLLEMKLSNFTASASSEKLQFRVVAISRDNHTLIPKSDTRFKYNDLVFIITKKEGQDALLKYMGKTNINVEHLMILGGGRIGEMIAKQLSSRIDDIKIIEKDRERCSELQEQVDKNVEVVCGDGRNSDFLLDENIKNYDSFVAVTGNDEANVLACVIAKKLGIQKTIAEVENFEYIHIAEDMGVDAVINKKLITAGKIYKMTLSNRVKFVKYMNETNAEVLEYHVGPNSPITKAALKDIDFPENAVIGGVVRNKEAFIAVGNTILQAYDSVAVFALPDAVAKVDKLFKEKLGF